MAYFRQRGNKWSFTADFGRDPITNKRNQVTRSGFNSKEEAQEAHDLMKAQHDSGNTDLDPSRMTVKEFMDFWLTSYCKRNLAIRTYENRVYLVNGRILPVLGHYKLKDITAIIINRFYADLDKKGYEPSYVKSIHSVLQKSMDHAVKWGLLTKSIMDNVDAPKLKKKKKIVWSLEQIDHYLTTAKEDMDSNYYIAILNYTYTGARRGEALGLRWSDIDFNRNVFSIEQAVVDTRTHGAFIQGTKTDSSKRLVELPEFLSKELKWHKKLQDDHIKRMGRDYKDKDLVAAKPNGDPLYPNWVLQKHKKHVEKIGLPYIPIHGLRHTHATALLQAGVHPKIVQERLGHSSITTTLDIYSHVTPNMQKEAIQVFDEKMKTSKKDQNVTNGK